VLKRNKRDRSPTRLSEIGYIPGLSEPSSFWGRGGRGERQDLIELHRVDERAPVLGE